MYIALSSKKSKLKTRILSSMAIGVLGILRDQFLKIPYRNGKIILSISLLITSSLIFLSKLFPLQSAIVNLLTDTNNPESVESMESVVWTGKHVSIAIDEQTIFTIIACSVSVFAMVATVYTSAMTYFGEQMTLNELLSTVGLTSKNPTITWLHGALFMLLVMALVGVLVVVNFGLDALVSLGVLIALLVIFFSLYLAVVWMLGLVIWALMESCYEMGALGRAGELIKGEKLLGFVQSLLLVVVAMAMSLSIGLEMIVLVIVNITCLVALFISVVYTVLYYECEKSHGEMGDGNEDSLVSPKPLLVDAAVP